MKKYNVAVIKAFLTTVLFAFVALIYPFINKWNNTISFLREIWAFDWNAVYCAIVAITLNILLNSLEAKGKPMGFRFAVAVVFSFAGSVIHAGIRGFEGIIALIAEHWTWYPGIVSFVLCWLFCLLFFAYNRNQKKSNLKPKAFVLSILVVSVVSVFAVSAIVSFICALSRILSVIAFLWNSASLLTVLLIGVSSIVADYATYIYKRNVYNKKTDRQERDMYKALYEETSKELNTLRCYKTLYYKEISKHSSKENEEKQRQQNTNEQSSSKSNLTKTNREDNGRSRK